MTSKPETTVTSPVSCQLTNIGHKRLLERQREWHSLNPADELMADICRQGIATLSQTGLVRQLLSARWIETAPASMTADEARLNYTRNPLQNLERFNFEMTTLCNFTCRHCRNGGVAPCTETDLPLLKESAETILSIGIRRFDFIGGEVSRFGIGWLELARHITDHDRTLDWQKPLIVTLYTNGWWLEKRNFKAAGKTYVDDMAFIRDMREHGVTHILFSIDGPEELHDEWRGHPGLFRRVFRGLAKVRQSDIKPRLSVVVRPGESLSYLAPFARSIYGGGKASVQLMMSDPTNLFSNLVDTARGTELRKGNSSLRGLDPSQIRCKAFFRPCPTIRIMANGALGICPLMQGQEGYGNIHERPLADLLNRLQETLLYRLHASGEIAQYLSQIDPAEFGESFDHVCAVRREVNSYAIRNSERGDP